MNSMKGKHLTLSERNLIEQGLNAGDRFATIAAKIGKHPSTISKEVRRHRSIKERPTKPYAPCIHAKLCEIRGICGKDCGSRLCHYCSHVYCQEYCQNYEPLVCTKLDKAPYVCNACAKRGSCRMERLVYVSKYADDLYRQLLSSAREGINQTAESIQLLDQLVSPLIRKGQSIAHIYAANGSNIGCSRRTLYHYIDQGVLGVRNLHLRRKVRYRPRKKPTQSSVAKPKYRKGRTYEDFRQLLLSKPVSVVEMDVVEGRKGGSVLLTLFFRSCSLMLIFWMKQKNQAAVKAVLDDVTQRLGVEAFRRYLPVILTDNGPEFQNPQALELAPDGSRRTQIFYCDPYHASQKGALEKNHEFIRYVLPKGRSFDHLTPLQIQRLMNHINATKRDSLGGSSPFQLSLQVLDRSFHKKLFLQNVDPDEVILNPDLIR